ncbi:syndecan-2 [Apodemus sylvaticus]|uniref:syndecan-2 n=1 Tax=Apodemus sylvaticus TaxID=10129 RepID=UPI00224340B0|nr:syndecan-2 [Apodemus sylvaticus]
MNRETKKTAWRSSNSGLGVQKPTSEKAQRFRGAALKQEQAPEKTARARNPSPILSPGRGSVPIFSRPSSACAGLHFILIQARLPGNMQRALILLTLGLMACVSAETRAELTSDKDMYLDNGSIEEASGVYPIDDDDYSSASGSGADEDIESPDMTTSRLIPRISLTSAAPKVETMTLKTQSITPAQTESPDKTAKEEVDISEAEEKLDPAVKSTDVYTEKHSDNLFKRTEVLAAVIAGGVIGFLFAIFLILLLVYRMRKKDEGSYDLGERKPSSAAYQKAPTKEFYA